MGDLKQNEAKTWEKG